MGRYECPADGSESRPYLKKASLLWLFATLLF